MAKNDKILNAKKARLVSKLKATAAVINLVVDGMDEWRIDMILMSLGGEALDRNLKDDS